MLERQGFASAALDAKLLTGHGLGLSTLDMALRENELVDDVQAGQVAALLQRRLTGESVARIIGEREFYGLAFALNAATLEPRPETELLVDLALNALPQGGRLLDLGTGTGCIPIAVLVNRPDASGVATDLSAEALAAARGNAERHGVSERLALYEGDWFAALLQNPHPNPPHKGEGTASRVGRVAETDHQTNSLPPVGRVRGGGSDAGFDLITSNPPYINSAVIETLEEGVRSFDPRLALDGGPDGLAPYRIIAAEAGNWLKPGGCVLVEIGYDQGEAVADLFVGAGFAGVGIHKDLNGLDRVVIAHHV